MFSNGFLYIIDALVNLRLPDSSQNDNFFSDFGVWSQNVDELMPLDAEKFGVDDALCCISSLGVKYDFDLSKVASAEHGFEGHEWKKLFVHCDSQMEDHFAFN